ncbi:MAG: DUF4922 domain-containing protein [Bacteroidales bacterium]|nr:DUF4922 domain-containing protein [Bacteroidales bacterium]
MATDIDKFVHDQLSVWPAVAAKYRALKSARTRTLPFGGILVTLQSNPGRLPIFDHGCPLCEENYMEQQHSLPFEGRKGRKYNILVNRAPIFPNHLVITRDIHAPQTIWHRFPDMLDLAAALEGYVVFYNSPNSGTSVPEHAHFQACPKGYLPLERVADRLLRTIAAGGETSAEEIEFIASVRDAELYHYKRFNRGIFMLRAQTPKSMAKMFYRLLDCLNLVAEDTEPRFNAFTYCSEGEYRAVVALRSAARPQCFYAQGDARFAISPGAAYMAGFVVVPEVQDFDRITPEVLRSIYDDVTLSVADEQRLLWRLVRTQPRIEVGILASAQITFEIISDGAGPQKVSYREGKIDYNGMLFDELVFEAVTISTLFAEPSFIIYSADGPQRFAGTLKFIVDGGKVEAVNLIGAEDYLLSVVSTSSGADSLQTRAISTRTWLMDLVRRRAADRVVIGGPQLDSTPGVVTWLEHRPLEAANADLPVHQHFDVCATEHCRRYIGLTPAADASVRAAVDETWGETLGA